MPRLNPIAALIPLLLAATALAQTTRPADDARPVVPDTNFAKDNKPNPALPTLFLVGDSTMNSGAPLRGWASEVSQFFDTSKLNVINRAIGGRSSKTFITEGKWDRVLSELKPGDFVVIQFGHNDAGRYDDPASKGRPSLKGEDDATATLTLPDGTQQTIHTFGWYLRKYGSDAKAKGATVFFCSMVPHKDWSPENKIIRNERQSFIPWTKNAAAATGAYFIDLNEISAEALEHLGPEKVEPLFGDKRTHSTPAGAKLNAQSFIAGLKALGSNPLAQYLSPAATNIPAAEASMATPAPAK